MGKARITISIDAETLNTIDTKRELTSRSAYINNCLNKLIKKGAI